VLSCFIGCSIWLCSPDGCAGRSRAIEIEIERLVADRSYDHQPAASTCAGIRDWYYLSYLWSLLRLSVLHLWHSISKLTVTSRPCRRYQDGSSPGSNSRLSLPLFLSFSFFCLWELVGSCSLCHSGVLLFLLIECASRWSGNWAFSDGTWSVLNLLFPKRDGTLYANRILLRLTYTESVEYYVCK
jgi:hypothetical protein